jgi:hypothetical protein
MLVTELQQKLSSMRSLKQKVSGIKSLFLAGLFLAGLICLSLIGTEFWVVQPSPAIAQSQTASEPIGIALEGLPYPHPVQFLNLTIEGQSAWATWTSGLAIAPTDERFCYCTGGTFRVTIGSLRFKHLLPQAIARSSQA